MVSVRRFGENCEFESLNIFYFVFIFHFTDFELQTLISIQIQSGELSLQTACMHLAYHEVGPMPRV